MYNNTSGIGVSGAMPALEYYAASPAYYNRLISLFGFLKNFNIGLIRALLNSYMDSSQALNLELRRICSSTFIVNAVSLFQLLSHSGIFILFQILGFWNLLEIEPDREADKNKDADVQQGIDEVVHSKASFPF